MGQDRGPVKTQALAALTEQRSFVSRWFVAALGSAVVLSTVDALLLQRSRSLFTGGFLAIDPLDGGLETAAFVLVSLLIDLAVAGLLAAIVMFVAARWRVRCVATLAGGFVFATGALILADAVSYELTRYLGVGFDLGLLFDLTGRSVPEFLAVAASHLLAPLLLMSIAGAGTVAVVWSMNRRPGARMDVAPARVLWLPAALLCVAIVGLTIAVSVSEAVGDGLLRKPSGQALQMVIGQATDVDRDGFGLIGRITDPAPFDSAIFPYGVDVPGNGVDEDGVAGDLPPHAAKYVETETSTAPWQRHPDIVLVVLESFRADLVGAQLDGQPITPVMTALAAGGLSLPRAYSHNGYTVQSRFHLLAGSLIAYRGARTLIDDARANGYRVGYFSGQDESFGSEEYRVGFDRADVSYDARADVANRYSTFATPGSLAVPFQAVENRVTGFVRDRGGSSQPLFIYVNFEDTHFPYSHDGVETIVSSVRLPRAQITAQNRAPLFKMYANTAANMDRAIGRVLDVVRQTRGREPAVIVTADHGESLFDEGFLGHGYGLNDAQTRVPLIVSNLPMRVPDPFSQIDLRPALNEALRAPPDRLAVAVADPVERPVFQYLGGLARPRQIAFVRRGERFIYDFRGGRVFTSQGSWTRVGEIGPPDQDELRKLINQWEWMNQAQRQHRNE